MVIRRAFVLHELDMTDVSLASIGDQSHPLKQGRDLRMRLIVRPNDQADAQKEWGDGIRIHRLLIRRIRADGTVFIGDITPPVIKDSPGTGLDDRRDQLDEWLSLIHI